MMRMTWCAGLALTLLPALASAQATPAPATAAVPARGFVALHFGAQSGESELVDGFSFPQYDETAAVAVRQSIGGGGLINFEGGARVYGRWYAGLAISRTSNNIETTVDASIPNPLVFDQPRRADPLTNEALKHSETGYHLFARYVFPVNDQFEIGVSAGPSFISVTHDVVTGISFQEGSAPFTTVTLTGTTQREESETVTAFNFGANATYRITGQFGVDGFFRYAKGSTDVAGASTGTVEISGGGAQFGVGVRYAF
jgi:opacity protein-like surface antigen